MPLKGKAKRLYQREYMKQRRGLTGGLTERIPVETKSIYFILDEEANAVKIGIGKSPEARLEELQIGNPHKLKLIKVIENKTELTELHLHQLFSKDHLNGEWFNLSKELRDYLNEAMSNLNVRPDVHCAQGLGKHCGYCKEAIFCPLGGYQYWFKQTYGYYDDRNRERCPLPQ